MVGGVGPKSTKKQRERLSEETRRHVNCLRLFHMTRTGTTTDSTTADGSKTSFDTPDMLPYLLGGLLALVLAMVVLRDAVGGSELFTSYQVIFAYLFLGMVGHVADARARGRRILVLGVQLTLTGLLVILVSLQSEGALPGIAWETSMILTFLLFLVYLVVGPAPREFIRENWLYLLAFAILLGIFIETATKLAPGSGSAMFPIAAGLTMGVNLFVVPRYVSRETFMWVLALLSGVVVLVGLNAYLAGQYTWFGLEVLLWDRTFSIPLLGTEVQYLQSFFANPNTLGLLAFAGAFVSLATAHRTLVFESRPLAGALASALFLVNAVGLYLSHSRASYLAAAVAGALYLSYVLVGRDYIRETFVAIVVLLALALTALFLFRFVNPSGRFVLWGAGIRAFLADPTLFGKGIVGTGELTAPYIEGRYRGHSVHNSYIAVLLRAGIVGFAAYLVLTVGSIIDGVRKYDRVDVAALALAFGFAVHHMFETYTLLQHAMTAVLATLAFGYLIVGIGLVPGTGRPGTRL